MTEQEKREKEVRKISEIIKQHYTPICTACFEEAKECFVCAADAVRDYMISKMEEVQKETAQKFLQLWYDDMFNAGECVGHIEKLAKEMGVKIDVFGAEV